MHYLFAPYAIIVLFYVYFLKEKDDTVAKFGIILIFIFLALLFGSAVVLQPAYYDSWRYMKHFERISQLSFTEMSMLEAPEIAFKYLNWIIGSMTGDYRVLFFSLFMIYITTTMFALKTIYSQHERFGLLIVMCTYPFFMTYIVNGKRQGVAMVFFLLALNLFWAKRKKMSLLFLMSAVLWHNSLFLTYPLILLNWILKHTYRFKVSLGILVASVLLSMTSISNKIVVSIVELSLSNSKYAGYSGELAERIGYRSGLRLDFMIFSFIPVVVYYYYRKRIKPEAKERVEYWVSMYMILNSLYHIASSVAYSDRFAAFSWFILPIVLYEILRGVNHRKADFTLVILSFLNLLLLQFYSGHMFVEYNLF